MTDTFEQLAENLSAAQKVEFLRVLNKHGITVESDTVLSKFFLTLQIYVAMYERIPESIHNTTIWFQAAVEKATKDFQKPVTDITRLRTEIEKLTEQAGLSAGNAEMSRTRIVRDLAQVDESMKSINSSIKTGAEMAAATVSNHLSELMSDAVEKSMPLSDLAAAGAIFSAAIKESEAASSRLRENVKTIKRSSIDAVVTCTAIALVFAVLGTWGFFYYWSERRIEEKRVYYLREISGNSRIVSELSESGRELILQNNYDGTKSLILESVIKGWTSIKNHGVIDFK